MIISQTLGKVGFTFTFFLMRLIHSCSTLIYRFIEEFSFSCFAFYFWMGCEPHSLVTWLYRVNPTNRPSLSLYYLNVTKSILLVMPFVISKYLVPKHFLLFFYSHNSTIGIYWLFFFLMQIDYRIPLLILFQVIWKMWISECSDGCSTHILIVCGSVLFTLFLGFLLLNWE